MCPLNGVRVATSVDPLISISSPEKMTFDSMKSVDSMVLTCRNISFTFKTTRRMSRWIVLVMPLLVTSSSNPVGLYDLMSATLMEINSVMFLVNPLPASMPTISSVMDDCVTSIASERYNSDSSVGEKIDSIILMFPVRFSI